MKLSAPLLAAAVSSLSLMACTHSFDVSTATPTTTADPTTTTTAVSATPIPTATPHWTSPDGTSLVTQASVGIGTSSASNALSVVGGASFTQNIVAPTYTMTSDQRLKKDVAPLEQSLEKVLKLRAVSFRWNELAQKRGTVDQDKQLGFIAQEIEKLYPEAVKTDHDGFKSVNYSALISPVADAFQAGYRNLEAKSEKVESRVEHLESELKERDARIHALQSRLEALEKAISHGAATK